MNLLVKLFGKKWMFNSVGITLPKNIDTNNYYDKTVVCDNCGKYLLLLIKKGLYARYIITSIVCSYCGCKINKGA
jgi:hypothetical protein